MSPAVGIDANGNATVTWGNIPNTNGSNPGSFGRRLNAQGVPIEAADFRIATLTGTDQDDPAVAVDGQGDVIFTYRQVNGSGTSTNTDIFAQSFKYVNDVPTLNAISDLTVAAGAGQQTVNLAGIAPGGGESQTITVTAASDNTSVVPTPSVTYTSPNATGTLTFTPSATQSGVATITVTVMDNGGTANGGVNVTTRTFKVTVVGKPTANSQTVSTLLNTATAVTLTGSDPNTPPRTLTYTVTASPTHGTLSGTAPNLTYTPTAGYVGPDSFQFKVNNGVLDSAVATVSLTVRAPITVAGVQVNDGSAQRSEVRSLTVTFSGPVTFAGGTPTPRPRSSLQHVQDAANVANLAAAVSTNGPGQTVVTLTFSTTGNAAAEIDPISALNGGAASLADGRYQLTILSANVADANGAGPGRRRQRHRRRQLRQPDRHLRRHRPAPVPPLRRRERRRRRGRDRPGPVPQHVQRQFVSQANYLAYLDADNSGAVDASDLGQFRSRFNVNVF